jgi:hypothetical protein
MVFDQSQMVQASGAAASKPRQCTAGVMPPQLGEARIREAFPVVRGPVAQLGQKLVRTVFLAPLGWALLAPLFAKKFAPFVCERYTLTNQRLMIQRGLKPSPIEELKLEEIDEVRLDPGSVDAFYHTGTLEVIRKGQVAMRLPGTPEPEGFRHAIINAVKAWVPSKANGPFQPASAVP